MRIASEYIDRDESRERAGSVATMFATNHASSNATRVARNSSMFDCEEGRKQTNNIFEREDADEATSGARELHVWIDWVLREHTNLWLKKSKKETTIN